MPIYGVRRPADGASAGRVDIVGDVRSEAVVASVFLEPRYSTILRSAKCFNALIVVLTPLPNSSANATALIPGEETIRL